MPVVSITLLPGYAPDTQHRMVNRVAQAVRSVIVTPEAGTTVFINEVSTYRRDGQVLDRARAAQPVAAELVTSFLQALQSQDWPTAQRFVHPDFGMHWPGAEVMHNLADLTAWADLRFSAIGKTITRVEESWQGDVTVVFCQGSLHGTWRNGPSFEGVRFIDRLEVCDGLITRQDVWHDLTNPHGS